MDARGSVGGAVTVLGLVLMWFGDCRSWASSFTNIATVILFAFLEVVRIWLMIYNF